VHDSHTSKTIFTTSEESIERIPWLMIQHTGEAGEGKAVRYV
jgi:hypothetical protein